MNLSNYPNLIEYRVNYWTFYVYLPHFNAELLLTLMKLSYIVVLAMGILNFNLIQKTAAEEKSKDSKVSKEK